MVFISEKVSAIVPVFNEEKTVSYVISELKKCKHVGEIIVINDYSSDKTQLVLEKIKGIKLIKNSKNLGKGECLEKGVQIAKYKTLLFCDGDYTVLEKNIFDKIILPVLKGGYEMYIGVQDNKFNRKYLESNKRISHSFFIAGLRAIKKEKWVKFPKIYKKRFRIEIGLSFYIPRYGGKWGYRLVKYDFIRKEQKHGLWKGVYYRVLMCLDIALAYFISRVFGNLVYFIKKFLKNNHSLKKNN